MAPNKAEKMKHAFLALGLGLTLATAFAPQPASARGVIETACLRSERPAANRALCGCIQTVADAVLSSSEQRRGAKFFADPDLSQEVKMSDRRSDDLFWDKWESFADGAVRHCQ